VSPRGFLRYFCERRATGEGYASAGSALKRLRARRAATMALLAWAALGAWAGTGYAQAKPVPKIPLKPMPQAPANPGKTTMDEGGSCASADPSMHCARFRNTTNAEVKVYIDGAPACLLGTPLRSAATGEILAPSECTRALKGEHKYEMRDLDGNPIRDSCTGGVGQCAQQMAAEDAAADAAANQAANAAGNPSFNAPPPAAPAPAKGSAAKGGGGGGAMLALVAIAGGAAVAAAVASKASAAGSVKTLHGFCSSLAARPCVPCTCTTHANNSTCDTGDSNNAACGGGFCFSGPGMTHAPFC
jgi:hypothetical protein